MGNSTGNVYSEKKHLIEGVYAEPDLDQYFKKHLKNSKFSADYAALQSKIYFWSGFRYFLGGLGSLFAAGIINPNYTSSRSFYFRKFNIAFFAYLGYSLGNRFLLDKMRQLELESQYHLPVQGRRAFQDRDFRYFLLLLEKDDKIVDSGKAQSNAGGDQSIEKGQQRKTQQ